jgi:hypothetical protein
LIVIVLFFGAFPLSLSVCTAILYARIDALVTEYAFLHSCLLETCHNRSDWHCGRTGAAAARRPAYGALMHPGGFQRIYLLLGVTSIASTVATLRLEAAMIFDHDRREQPTCFEMVAYGSTCFAILLTFAAAFAHVGELPQAQKLRWFGLITIGIGTRLVANNQALLVYATSCNAFGKAALAKICSAGMIALSQLALLLPGTGEGGLIGGQMIWLIVGLFIAIFLLSPPRPNIFLMPNASQSNYLKKHQPFRRFSLPAGLLNIAAGRFPLFLIGAKYGLFAPGLLALTERVLTAPVSLLAALVLEVFKRQSVHESGSWRCSIS